MIFLIYISRVAIKSLCDQIVDHDNLDLKKKKILI